MESGRVQKRLIKTKLKIEPLECDMSESVLKKLRPKGKQRVMEYFCSRVSRKRSGMEAIAVHRSVAVEEFREFARKCPITPMNRFQVKQLRGRIQARGLQDKYKQLTDGFIQETKKEYLATTREAGVGVKIKGERIRVKPLKYLGRTENYPKFLSIRSQLQKRFLLHLRGIREVHSECVLNLPHELFELSFDGVLEFQEFKETLEGKLEEGRALLGKFRARIQEILYKAQPEEGISFLGACTGLLSVHISRTIGNTLMHIVEFTDSKEVYPCLKLNVSFEKGLLLKPDAQDVIQAYKRFLNKIVKTVSGFEVALKKNPCEKQSIYLCSTEEFVAMCEESISGNIRKLYEPVGLFLESFEERFKDVCEDIVRLDPGSYSDLDFEDGCRRMALYRGYLYKVLLIPDNEYFNFAVLNLESYRRSLERAIRIMLEMVFSKLSGQHYWEISDINESFQLIQTRATQKPITTEELIDTGKFMALVRDEQLEQLKERINKSFATLTKFIHLGFLPDYHIELTSDCFEWLNKIGEIVEQHSTNFDQLKFEAEEYLQKVIEEVNIAVKDVYPFLVLLDEMDDIQHAKDYLKQIIFHMSKIKEIELKISWINNEEVCLSFPKSVYFEFDELKDYVYPFYHLLKTCVDVQRSVSVWMDGQFNLLQYEHVSKSFEATYKELIESQKVYRKKIRKAQDENNLIKFKGTVDDPDILNWPAPLKLCGKALKLLEEFRPSIAVIKIMCNPVLKLRHWKAMSDIAGINLTPNAGTTLRKLMKIDLKSNLENYELISAAATKEQQLLDDLDELKDVWKKFTFDLLIDQENITFSRLMNLDEIEEVLEDQIVKVHLLQCSVLIDPHKGLVLDFCKHLEKIQCFVENWKVVQEQITKLLPIFTEEGSDATLAGKVVDLNAISAMYIGSVEKINKNSNINHVILNTNIVEQLSECVGLMEGVQAATRLYLSKLRGEFGRFYFLSDEQLIDVISSRSDYSVTQIHLGKLFQGIDRLIVDDRRIVGARSFHGEKIEFPEWISASEKNYFKRIEQQVLVALKLKLSDCIRRLKLDDVCQNFTAWPQQILQTTLQVQWTEKVGNCLMSPNNIMLRLFMRKREEFAKRCADSFNRGLSNLERHVVSCLVTGENNNLHYLRALADSDNLEEKRFEWEAQLKYYLEGGNCSVKALGVDVPYSYEYLGNVNQFVITPLADRCIRTLINANYLRLNGLLVGSSSGKTETLRYLTSAFALPFITFNCSENLSYETIQRYLKGSAFCGAWLYLRKIDKIKPEILAALSEEIAGILSTMKASSSIINSAPTKQTFFLTVSLGRPVKLPENFKILFRTVTLSQPDLAIIADVHLKSIGFSNGAILARKIQPVLEYANISSPDNSVTAVRKILQFCDSIKASHPTCGEDVIFIEAVKKFCCLQMPESRAELFEAALLDVFCDCDGSVNQFRDENDSGMEQFVAGFCQKYDLMFEAALVAKMRDLVSMLRVFNNLILVGAAGCGKTNVVKMSVEYLRGDGEVTYLNPETLTVEDMLGRAENGQFVDGIISELIRKSSSQVEFVVFDEMIDGTCAEQMDSVLSESRNLYSPTGEIINLPDSLFILFEVQNLDSASPGMVTRCGRIYFAPGTINWQHLLHNWSLTVKSNWTINYRNYIVELLKWIIPACLEFVGKFCSRICDLDEMSFVKNALQLVKMILDEHCGLKDEEKNMVSWIQATLIQAGIWGFSSVLDKPSKQKFDEFYKLLWRGQQAKYPKCMEKLDVSIPQEGLLEDYYYIYKQRGVWKSWNDILKTAKISESPFLSQFLVPTVDTVRYLHFIELYVKNKQNVIVFGPADCGKTMLIREILYNKIKGKQVGELSLTNNMTANLLQNFIMYNLTDKKGCNYFPAGGKDLLVYMDDLNETSKGNIELLRQLLDHNIWYSRNYKRIKPNKINFIFEMALSINGTALNRRITRHLNSLGMNELSEEGTVKIYATTLQYVWKKAGFPADIITVINQIVSATLSVYCGIRDNLRITMSSPHYIFSMFNFTQAMQRFIELRKDVYDGNKKVHVKLWAHEIGRVFGDRLNCGKDSAYLSELIRANVNETFKEDFEELFDTLKDPENPTSKLLFGSYINQDNEDNKRYEEVGNLAGFYDVASEALIKYNNSNEGRINLVLLENALIYLSKICRILSKGSNGLLIAPVKSGRKALVKLANFMFGYKYFQAKIISKFDSSHWDFVVKQALIEAGCVGKHCTLLISEEELMISEGFLEHMNHLFKNGFVPFLFSDEEKSGILEKVKLAAQGGNRNVDIPASEIFLFFNKRCRENLHGIVCLNWTNGLLRRRLRSYPCLIRSNVIWWNDWSDEVYKGLSRFFLSDTVPEQIVGDVGTASVGFHRDAQRFGNLFRENYQQVIYVSSGNFEHFLELYKELMKSKQESIMHKKRSFLRGLNKLSTAANQILGMQKALADYQPQLAEMTQKASEMTKQIALETIEVEKASALVRKDEKIAGEQAAVAQLLKSECEAELAQAIPILEDAISALNTLKPSDITLVKSMKNPPDAIKLVMAAVCVIKDVKPDRIPDPSTGRKYLDYWGPSKRILGDMNFLQSLKDFDKDHIKPEIIVKIRKEYLPHKDFKPHVVAKASSAAEGLCKWIIAMDMYDRVAKEVAPKKEKLEKAEKEYAQTIQILNQKKEEVARIEEKLAELNSLLDEATRKQQLLQVEVDLCNRKLKKAQTLISGLSEEKDKWTLASENLQNHYDCLPGDILLTAAHIAYLSNSDKGHRQNVLLKWHKEIISLNIPCNENFSFSKILLSEADIENFFSNGLPQDDHFIANAIILSRSKLFSIIADPEYLASGWIKHSERFNNLNIIKLTQGDYLGKLKDSLVSGKPLLIENISERLPLWLMNLLKKNIFLHDERRCVELEDGVWVVNKDFRLYVTCLERHPNFPEEVSKSVLMVNFGYTDEGFIKALLTTVMEIEKPELKLLKKDLSRRDRINKAEIKELEDKILFTLSESDTDILEDEKAIQILGESKNMAKVIEGKQKEVRDLERTIWEFKSKYVRLSEFVCDLYGCVSELKKLDYVYQFSLEWFLNIYHQSIANAAQSRDVSVRCENIKEAFTYELYLRVTRSLYERHKVLFSCFLCFTVNSHKKLINEIEFNFLIGRSGDKWESLERLENLEYFQGFRESFIRNIKSWKDFLSSEQPLQAVFPGKYKILSLFQKLLLIKVFRPEKLHQSLVCYVNSELGSRYLRGPGFDVREVYNDSHNLSPILFILDGDDPEKIISHFADEKRFSNKLFGLSVSDEEASKADALIESGREHGFWILLQNCHLALNFLRNFQLKLELMDYFNTHENFRLWLTTQPHSELPIPLLQNSVKIIYDRPDKQKDTLRKLYKTPPVADKNFYYGSADHDKFVRLLYALGFFCSLVRARESFQEYKWTFAGKLTDSDFRLMAVQLKLLLQQPDFSTWHLKSLVSEYGLSGYSGDFLDRLTLNGLLEHSLNIINNKNLPSKNDYDDYLEYINAGNFDLPELFQLHNNSWAVKEKRDSRNILNYFRRIKNCHGSISSVNEEKLSVIIADILEALPESPKGKNQNVSDDLSLYNQLIATIKLDMCLLKRVEKGELLLDEKLEAIATNLVSNITPPTWLKYVFNTGVQVHFSYFLSSIGMKIRHLVQVEGFGPIWPAAFNRPRSIILEFKIKYCKANKVPVENIYFQYEPLENLPDPNKNELVLIDLFLSGGMFSFSEKLLKEPLGKIQYHLIKYIRFVPIQKLNTTGYRCPMLRANLEDLKANNVSEIVFNSSDTMHWIKRGLKLFCEIVDYCD